MATPAAGRFDSGQPGEKSVLHPWAVMKAAMFLELVSGIAVYWYVPMLIGLSVMCSTCFTKMVTFCFSSNGTPFVLCYVD